MFKAKQCYEKLSTKRMPYLNRAMDCAAVTLPTLFPYPHIGATNTFPTPNDSTSARGVNHLSAKLLLTLLPPNSPFFRMVIEEKKMAELDARPDLKAQITSGMAAIERRIMREIELKSLRVPIHDCLKQLIVAGNALLYMPDAGGVRVFPLSQYVVDRDCSGNVLKIVTHESMSREALPREIEAVLEPSNEDKEFGLYTLIDRIDDDTFEVSQFIEDMELPDQRFTFKEDELPYQALRWSVVNGEAYGRGLVEEYMGDILSLESLSKAINEAAAMSARVVMMIDPNGITEGRDIIEAPNGGVIQGRQSEVSFLQVNKFADMQVAASRVAEISRRIEAAFLLNTSVARNAERVTAEEIRLLANELESTLGGVYAVLSQTLQQPIVRSLIRQLQKSGEVVKFPSALKKYIQPTVITGVEALGRSSDIEKIRTFLALGASFLGPQEMIKRINPSIMLQNLAINLGVNIIDLLKSEAQMEQEAQAQQQAMLTQIAAQKGIAPTINQVGQSLREGSLSPPINQG